MSPSSRRAWIEIRCQTRQYEDKSVALLAEGVDRNYKDQLAALTNYMSPSSRRAWIEMIQITMTS